MVCSNREAWKRPAESNGTPAMDLGHINVVLKWCICMLVLDLGIGMIITVIIMIKCFFFPCIFFLL